MSKPTPAPRVQFVISWKFFVLLLLAAVLLGIGYYSYTRQQQLQKQISQMQERFKTPPYFVNRGPSVIRSCSHCLEEGKLKPQTGLAVEDPPVPVTVSGVLMLPVHPTLQDNPALGFDQTRVMLVLFQNLERKPWIEQPAPPPPVAPVPTTEPAPNPDTTRQ